jgi:multiple sugar transport system permease protein
VAGEAISVGKPTRDARRAIFAGSPYLLIAPALLFMAAVSVYPLYYGVRASLAQYRYGREQGFAGLDNYRRVLGDDVFWQALYVTLKFVVLAVTIETVLGVALAVLLSRDLRFAGVIRTGLIIPMTVAPVVVGIVWRLIYASDVGIVNPLFRLVGLNAPDVLSHGASAFVGLVAVDVWEWTPLIMLIVLAGLNGLPRDPIEGARVDGASEMRVFFDHTLPLVRPVLLVAIILRTIDAIGTFDQVFVLTKGGPGTSTQLIAIYGYNTAFRFSQYGQASAMMLLVLAGMSVLLVAAIRTIRGAAKRTAGA